MFKKAIWPGIIQQPVSAGSRRIGMKTSAANRSHNECTKSNLKIYQAYTKFISITTTYNLTRFCQCLFIVSRK